MAKDARFIAELRNEAKRRGLEFRVETWRGKGQGDDRVVTGNRPQDGAKNQEGARSRLKSARSPKGNLP